MASTRSKNVTRQNIERDPRNPEDHLNSGYEDGPSEGFTIPPCGIVDADTAIFDLFDKDLGFTEKSVRGANKEHQLKKPFVIFAVGERYANAKKLRPPRDTNAALLLPAISIRRTSFDQTKDDITGRGMNQHTGNITIKRRLDESDRDYQNLLNKIGLENMTNMPSTRREDAGEEKETTETRQGAYLDSRLGNNVWEIISIPQPQFFTTTYEVTFWTSYALHMNMLIEQMVSNYLPQGKMFQLKTDKGYWFMSYVDDQIQSADNFVDYKEQERLVRYTFNMRVKGYILVSNHPTGEVPIRRWVSAPTISFEIDDASKTGIPVSADAIARIESQTSNDKFTLTEVGSDPSTRQDPTTTGRLRAQKIFTDKGKKRSKYVRILERNEKKGETVYRASSPEALDEFIKSFK